MFSVGDTVRLKSGGPTMTVEAVDHHEGVNMVHCVWFDDKKQLQRQTFLMDVVEKS
jgi:uncharacterized protein YodC (DUF2158 family)